jgi:chromosome segregation ATPase
MSDTPRTDAAFKLEAFFDGVGIVETVLVEFARQLETELADKDRRLAEARARIDHLERIIDEMTEEQAALCAEGQTITELVAAKDKLIEQMREALRLADDLIDEYAADYEHRDNVDEVRDEIKAALSAAERGK